MLPDTRDQVLGIPIPQLHTRAMDPLVFASLYIHMNGPGAALCPAYVIRFLFVELMTRDPRLINVGTAPIATTGCRPNRRLLAILE